MSFYLYCYVDVYSGYYVEVLDDDIHRYIKGSYISTEWVASRIDGHFLGVF